MTIKTCPKCHQPKPLDKDHYGRRGDGFSSWCHECRRSYDRNRRSNPDRDARGNDRRDARGNDRLDDQDALVRGKFIEHLWCLLNECREMRVRQLLPQVKRLANEMLKPSILYQITAKRTSFHQENHG